MHHHPTQIDLLILAARFGFEAEPEGERGVVFGLEFYDIETGEVGREEYHCRSLDEMDLALARALGRPC